MCKNFNSNIYIAGHRGMVGSSIVRKLETEGYQNLITRKHSELDLIDQVAVKDFFFKYKPDQVFLCAAKVGGIFANNTYPADYIYENLMIQANVINAAFLSGVKKILFLGSSCIYPKIADQPMKEESLLSGKLEPTNEPYAIAKIAGIKICESYNRQYSESYGVDYRCIMPANLYGPGDNYSGKNSHVIPALIKRFHEAKVKNSPNVYVWGTGKPRREFLYVDDLAEACILLMNIEKKTYDEVTDKMRLHINVGSGKDLTTKELAENIKEVIGYKGEIRFDDSKPDGSPQKLLNSERIKKLNWKPNVGLNEGLKNTYQEYIKSL